MGWSTFPLLLSFSLFLLFHHLQYASLRSAKRPPMIYSHRVLKRKKRENAEKLKADELTKKDRRLFVEYLEKMKDSNDSILSGMRRLNESCMNFKGNLSDSLLDLLDKMLEEDQRKNEEGNPVKVLEHLAGFASRGRAIFFRMKFTESSRGFLFRNIDHGIVSIRSFDYRQKRGNMNEKIPTFEELRKKFVAERRRYLNRSMPHPMIQFEDLYKFEAKFLKLKPVDRHHNDYRIYKYDEFVNTFSTPKWNMSLFLEGFATRNSLENITVEDPLGIHYAVKILSETHYIDLERYIKVAYLIKTPYYHFMKRRMVEFPNETDSSQYDDCISLVSRYFPFVMSAIKKDSTPQEFFDWVQNATAAVKKAFYRQIDDSDFLEPFDKIILLNIIKKMKVFVYNNKTRDIGNEDIAFTQLAKEMNSTDLIHNMLEFEGSPANSITEIEDSAYTLIVWREVFLQLHYKESDVYNTLPQVGMARIVNILGHEFGHHFTDYIEFIYTSRGFSDRFLRHLRNTLDCYRKVGDEGLKESSIFGLLSDVNTQRVLREVSSDIMGVQVGPEAYSYLDIDLLPGMKTKEQMYYLATTSSSFYCKSRNIEDLMGFFDGTHPVQSQRIEYIRLFDTSPHFEATFNCKQKKPVCPNVF